MSFDAVRRTFLLITVSLSFLPGVVPAEETASSYKASVARAVAFLRSTGQAADGSFSSYAGPRASHR